MKELDYRQARRAMKEVVEGHPLIRKLAGRVMGTFTRENIVDKKRKITKEYLREREVLALGVVDEVLRVFHQHGYTVSSRTRESLAAGLLGGFWLEDTLSRRAELLRPDRSAEHARPARKKSSDDQWD
jgi:hypothetical protein